MDKLKRTSVLVRTLLEEDERCRNSDSYLYLKVVTLVAERLNIDLRTITIQDFLLEHHGTVFPPFETVRRARQKVQEATPALCPSKAVKGVRDETEKVFRAFARSEL